MVKIEEKDGRKYWVLSIDGDEVFGRVSRDTNYREHALENGGAKFVLLDDDRPLFGRLLKSGLPDLVLLLARMSKNTDRAVADSGDSFQIRLEVTDNYDDNLTFALQGYVDDYVDACVLKEWFSRNNMPPLALSYEELAAIALRRIATVIHYRKRAVKRPVHPIF